MNRIKHKRMFTKGFMDGLPVCLGYFPIAFAFGMTAASNGLHPLIPIGISMTNLTSAGQFAGLDIILNGGGYIELAVTIFVINIRYMLMSLALTQKLDSGMSTLERLVVAFGNTDEIFAIAIRQDQALTTPYLLGLICSPYIGWSAGTIFGATATGFLPLSVQSALSITIYAMFLAIIIPPARKSKPVLYTVIIAAAVSCIFKYVPFLNGLGTGWVIIIAAVVAAGIVALRFPSDNETQEEAG